MKANAISLRLDDEQARQVKELAERFKVKDVDIIRWSIDALWKYVELHGGKLHLPIDFDVMWQQVRASLSSFVDPAAAVPGEHKAKRRTA